MEKFVLRERLVDKNGWQHYVYQAGECALHGTYVYMILLNRTGMIDVSNISMGTHIN